MGTSLGDTAQRRWKRRATDNGLVRDMVLGESHGGDARVKGARFPQVKTLEDFDFSFQLR